MLTCYIVNHSFHSRSTAGIWKKCGRSIVVIHKKGIRDTIIIINIMNMKFVYIFYKMQNIDLKLPYDTLFKGIYIKMSFLHCLVTRFIPLKRQSSPRQYVVYERMSVSYVWKYTTFRKMSTQSGDIRDKVSITKTTSSSPFIDGVLHELKVTGSKSCQSQNLEAY
jgi:hypothetical protein